MVEEEEENQYSVSLVEFIPDKYQRVTVASFIKPLAPEVRDFFIRIGLVSIEDFAIMNIDEVCEKMAKAKIHFILRTKLEGLKAAAHDISQNRTYNKRVS
jgi:hypothetical protein